jgi:rod shape-determining protein MreD
MVLIFSALAAHLPVGRAVPDVVALFAVYLGLSARERIAPSMASAVLLGYLADLVIGTPRGLLAFSAGAICLAGHLVQGRLLVRGWLFTAIFSFFTSLLSGCLALAVRATLGDWLGFARESRAMLVVALLTALLGPIVFRLCRGIDAKLARTHRERDLVLEGIIP